MVRCLRLNQILFSSTLYMYCHVEVCYHYIVWETGALQRKSFELEQKDASCWPNYLVNYRLHMIQKSHSYHGL